MAFGAIQRVVCARPASGFFARDVMNAQVPILERLVEVG